MVPAGAEHNITNTGESPMKLYGIHVSPEHRDGVVQETKADAQARHHNEQFDGVTSE